MLNVALNKSISSNSWSTGSSKKYNGSHPSLAIDGKSDRLVSKGWVSACSAKMSQVCTKQMGRAAKSCQDSLHDWQPGEDKPYLEIDMGRLVKVSHLKATNFEDLDSRTGEWSLHSSVVGKKFRKLLHGDASSHATWDMPIPNGAVGRYFRFVLEKPRGGKASCQGLVELELHGQDKCVSKAMQFTSCSCRDSSHEGRQLRSRKTEHFCNQESKGPKFNNSSPGKSLLTCFQHP